MTAPPSSAVGNPALHRVLLDAQRFGFLGPSALEQHIDHAAGFAVGASSPKLALDLGSGGGVPGLVLLSLWPESRWVLLDAMKKRCDFLRQAVTDLGAADRVRVVWGRSEEVGHQKDLRSHCDLVTARGFGQPQLTVEAASPFLRVGGRLVVSEPPTLAPSADDPRWPTKPLRTVGLRTLSTVRSGGANYRVLEKVSPIPREYPRPPKDQQRAPLWGQPGKKTA